MLIDIFAKYKIKVTFFVVGAWVDKYPESVKALSDAGHEVMNHSDDHAHFNSLSTQQIISNINACNDKIEAITGVRPTLFRPPYGEYDDHVISAVRSMGMEPIQWDVEASHAASSRWGARGLVEPFTQRLIRWEKRPDRLYERPGRFSCSSIICFCIVGC
ncbi:hypothetical protein SDC9_93880 [bioreactor metagenome]|uniref:NodB homology domain-containing protein n=1 Tax=bioreactor metagenome TaxID=1076179 RepID=A0A645A2B8_9ZZZZ